MQNLTSKLVRFLDNNLGRCPACMKTAFLCVFICWAVVFVAEFIWPIAAVLKLVYLITIGFTALWLLHFGTYTARVLMALWSEYIGSSALSDIDSNGVSNYRRNLLSVCANALSLGILASVWLPTTAFARGQKCGKGYCPDSAPNCCSRRQGKCCDGIWACTKTGTCHSTHSDARRTCGKSGIVWGCG